MEEQNFNEVSPQDKVVQSSEPGAASYMLFEHSPHVCVDFLWWFPPNLQDMRRSF